MLRSEAVGISSQYVVMEQSRHTGFPDAPMRDTSPPPLIHQTCPLLNSLYVSNTLLSIKEAMKT